MTHNTSEGCTLKQAIVVELFGGHLVNVGGGSIRFDADPNNDRDLNGGAQGMDFTSGMASRC